jgi:hypothetical protein
MMLLGCVPYVTFFGAGAVLYALNEQGAEARVSTTLNVVLLVRMLYSLNATSAAVALAPLLPILAVHRTCYVSARDVVLPQVPPLLAAAGMGGASRYCGCTLRRMCRRPSHCRCWSLPASCCTWAGSSR